MIVTTGNEVARREIVGSLGIARGIVVRSTSVGQSMIGALRTIGGGNITEYTQVCEEARREAYELMIAHAREREADGVIGMRYDATEFGETSTEVLACGTGVRPWRRRTRPAPSWK